MSRRHDFGRSHLFLITDHPPIVPPRMQAYIPLPVIQNNGKHNKHSFGIESIVLDGRSLERGRVDTSPLGTSKTGLRHRGREKERVSSWRPRKGLAARATGTGQGLVPALVFPRCSRKPILRRMVGRVEEELTGSR